MNGNVGLYVQQHSEGKVTLPRWAMLMLIASRAIRGPVFLGPFVLLTVAAYAATAGAGWPFVRGVVFSAVVSLLAAVGAVTRSMVIDGVLADYLSLLAVGTKLGRFLIGRFGRAI